MASDKFKVGDLVETVMLWPGEIVEILEYENFKILFAKGFVGEIEETYFKDKPLTVAKELHGVEIITQQQYDTRVRLGKKALQKIWRSVKGDREEYLKIVDSGENNP